MIINTRTMKRIAVGIAIIGFLMIAWFLWDAIQSGQQARRLQNAREVVADYETQKQRMEQRAGLRLLTEELGVIEAADAHAKGMSAAEYNRLKEAATMETAINRIQAENNNR